jgi:hypothetical protein
MARAFHARGEALWPRARGVCSAVALMAPGCAAVDPEPTGEPTASLTPSERSNPYRDGGASSILVPSPAPSVDAGTSHYLPDGTPRFPACEWPEMFGRDSGVHLELGSGDLTVLVVFDKSTSMDWRWDHRTRWEAASEALVAAIAPNAPNLTVAAVLFPQGGYCSVSPLGSTDQIGYRPGQAFLNEWLSRACWPRQAWGTPLGLAMHEANAAIDQAARLGLLDDRFRIMVVTDGEPTCEEDEGPMTDHPRAWRELGIETFVIGLPGSEAAREVLDSIAEAGGTGSHLSPGTPEELQGQFAQVVK